MQDEEKAEINDSGDTHVYNVTHTPQDQSERERENSFPSRLPPLESELGIVDLLATVSFLLSSRCRVYDTVGSVVERYTLRLSSGTREILSRVYASATR